MHNHNYKHEFKLEKDGGFVLTITFSKQEIQATYDKILAYLARQVDIKGFRKGGVPVELAKKQLNPDTVIQETFQELLSPAYSHILQDENVKPIMDPQIKLISSPLELGKDWTVECSGSQKPKITLKKGWEEKIKAIKSTSREEKVNQTLAILQSEAIVELAPVLLQADIQNKLRQDFESGLLNNKKEDELESYKKDLEKKVRDEWALNLSLEVVANDNNLTVDPKEIEAILAKPENSKVNPNLIGYLLRQQKAIDFLLQ